MLILRCAAIAGVACIAWALWRSGRRDLVWQTYKAQDRAREAAAREARKGQLPVGHPDVSSRVRLSGGERCAFEVIAKAEDPDLNASLDALLDREDGDR